MLIADHEKYHAMAPKDVGLKAVMPLQVTRTTAETGEQFTFEVPIYPDDSREMVKDRVNFALSIMQDRMEDINQSMVEAREKAQKAFRAKAMTNQVRALEKRLKRGKISQEEFDKELAEISAKFGDAIAAIEAGNEIGGELEVLNDEADDQENQLAEA